MTPLANRTIKPSPRTLSGDNMTVTLGDLDAHEQPSEHMRREWKAFTKVDHATVLKDSRIDDTRSPQSETGFKTVGSITKEKREEAFRKLGLGGKEAEVEGDAPIVHHPMLPGLLIVPDLLPPTPQKHLVNLLLHRDLPNPTHQTNMHLHFNLPYPQAPSTSFFHHPPLSEDHMFTPKDPSVHKPQTTSQVLNKKLHWVTLGGQYDWTNRVYPDGKPPEFPRDIGGFLEDLFPKTEAQAAIVNFYGPGDTMMMHRDVSEEANRGLVSLSLGCDGLFMIAPSKSGQDAEGREIPEDGTDKDGKGYLLLRLRSGDAIYMTEESRYAWHGVPKVVKGTCPEYLRDMPAGSEEDGEFEAWRGWMGNKRINLNVRQMRE